MEKDSLAQKKRDSLDSMQNFQFQWSCAFEFFSHGQTINREYALQRLREQICLEDETCGKITYGS